MEKIRGDVGQNQLDSDIDSRVETWRTAVGVPQPKLLNAQHCIWTQEASVERCFPTHMSMKTEEKQTVAETAEYPGTLLRC